MRTFLDRETGRTGTVLEMGDYHVTSRGTLLLTVLGSCVCICLYDRVTRVAGMNHYVLPHPPPGRTPEEPGRYGTTSIELLLRTMFTRGCAPDRLDASVFGGASMGGSGEVGASNVAMALTTLAARGVVVRERDVGGPVGRRVRFDTATGRARTVALTGVPG